ncbi:MAG TPA: adenine phosphoribosyltransferase [Candidatus Dormibacteraeota bacterium]|nr:adenine phosphoribosyltransferase [Candidatus Dormibacteraeota bacterium]
MPEAVPVPEVDLRSFIRTVPDYPKPGILFRDITPLLGDGAAFRSACERMTELFRSADVGAVASIESRGFTFGAVIAFELGVGVVPVRKAGRLPAARISSSYELEYGEAVLEMHQDAIAGGTRVLVVDDLLATGGTALATLDLINRLGGVAVGFAFVVELLALQGRERLGENRVEALLAL